MDMLLANGTPPLLGAMPRLTRSGVVGVLFPALDHCCGTWAAPKGTHTMPRCCGILNEKVVIPGTVFRQFCKATLTQTPISTERAFWLLQNNGAKRMHRRCLRNCISRFWLLRQRYCPRASPAKRPSTP